MFQRILTGIRDTRARKIMFFCDCGETKKPTNSLQINWLIMLCPRLESNQHTRRAPPPEDGASTISPLGQPCVSFLKPGTKIGVFLD